MNRWFCIAAVALSLMLASCMPVTAQSASPTVVAATCPVTNTTPSPNSVPTALGVVRPYNYVRELPAFARCVRDATGVQRLYAAILALPERAPGDYSCPNGQGIVYNLTFLAGVAIVRAMTLEADGCRFIHLSGTDVRATDDAFFQQFAATLGLTQTQLFS